MQPTSRVLAIALLCSACVDDPALGTDDAALAGVLTNARPEVGRFRSDTGGTCMATLIAPRVIVTAPCFASAWSNRTTAPPPGAAFTFTDKSGVVRTYAIDRVRGFHAEYYERVLDDAFGTTVTLGHLTTAVPTSEASPAPLAIALPALGANVRVFGWNVAGTPGKAALDVTFTGGDAPFEWDDADKGGPAFDAAGDAWGSIHRYVNYGGHREHLYNSLPFYLRQIEGVRLAWDGPDEPGLARAGTTYRTITPSTAPACRAACQADATCHAYTYYPNGSYCDLQAATAEARPRNGTTAGVPVRFELGTDRPGGDIATLTTPRADACAAACGRTATCRAWTWVDGSNTCWLKSPAAAPPQPCATCTSGSIARQWESYVDRPGHDYLTITTPDGVGCSDACRKDARCRAFTWVAFSKLCWLKDAAATPVPSSVGMVSGVRRGLEMDTNRGGGDYRSFGNPSLDPAVCQAACAAEAACQAWSFDNRVDSPKRCYLKSSVPTPTASVGVISGLKGLELL